MPQTTRVIKTVLVLSLILLGLILVMSLPNREEEEMDLSKFIPASFGAWSPAEDSADAWYDKNTIFDYMNGAGEVFLSFAYERMFVRHFSKGDSGELTVEIFDMGKSDDAYGIFTRARYGEDAGIGQGSEYRSGHLNFWKGRYFVSVSTMLETEESREDVLEISRAIASNIPDEGPLPTVVTLLPPENLIEKSIHFFHKHTELNRHYFIADENILLLDPGVEAVIASYEREDEFTFLLLIRYPTADRAVEAHRSFLEAYMPEAIGTGLTQIEDGYWTAVSSTGDYLAAVFDAPTSEKAQQLLMTAKSRLEGADYE